MMRPHLVESAKKTIDTMMQSKIPILPVIWETPIAPVTIAVDNLPEGSNAVTNLPEGSNAVTNFPEGSNATLTPTPVPIALNDLLDESQNPAVEFDDLSYFDALIQETEFWNYDSFDLGEYYHEESENSSAVPTNTENVINPVNPVIPVIPVIPAIPAIPAIPVNPTNPTNPTNPFVFPKAKQREGFTRSPIKILESILPLYNLKENEKIKLKLSGCY